MASTAFERKKGFAAARAFYLTLFVITALCAWRFVVPGASLGQGSDDGGLQKRGISTAGEVGLTGSDEDVRIAQDWTMKE